VSTRGLLACGVVGPALFVAVSLIEGALRPEYDPLRMQVSLLSLGDRGPIQVINFLVSGMLVVLFALGLRRSLARGRAATTGPVAIGAAGVGMLVAGVFSVQPSFGYPPGAPAGIGTDISPASYAHLLGAFLFLFGMVAASAIFALRFRAAGRSGWATASAIVAVVVLALFAASSGGPDGMPLVPDYAGLFQRISIITGLTWIAALAGGILAGRIETASQVPAMRR
jgi:uncharacterized membrane protein YhaH (DUF805 family)